MPKLRRLSGSDVVSILTQFGFVPLTQRGSHIKLRRVRSDGAKETLTVPNHRELDTGTARAILRQAGRFIPEEQLHPHFYTK
jgi:predicted RNA binding protein YcfA (HicA-like mRNA interferase family)